MGAERFDLEAEREILGAIQLDDTVMAMIEPLVKLEDFYHPAHALIYAAAQALSARGESIHVITIANELKAQNKLAAAGGAAYVASLTDSAPTTAHVESSAKLVQRFALARRVMAAAREVVAKGSDPTVTPEDLASYADQRLAEAANARYARDVVPIATAIDEAMERVMVSSETGRRIAGLTTGFYEIDAITSGMHPGQAIVIAARPAMGKTSLMMNTVEHVAQTTGQTVLVFSLEMPRTELAARLLCGRAGVDQKRMRSLHLAAGEIDRLVQASQQAYGLPIYIHDDGNVTLPELRAICRRIQIRFGLSLVAIDYLQLMRAGGNWPSREREIAEISRTIKVLAKELAVPMMVLSQLNRDCEKRADRRPMLSDLRESGAVEQDADVVAFVYREEVYDKENESVKNLAEVIVAKQRNGPTGTVHLRWNGAQTRFENLDPASIPRREKRGRRMQAAASAGYGLDSEGDDE